MSHGHAGAVVGCSMIGQMRGLAVLLGVAGCGRFGFGDVPIDPDACALVLDVGAPRINVNAHRTITASGGRAPVTFVASNDLVTVAPSSGELAAHTIPGTVTITATDAAGCSSESELVVGGDLMWYVGGTSNSVPTAAVLRSTNGLDWTPVGVLPEARYIGALVSFRDRLWWIAGHDGTNPRNEIYVSDDGVTWNAFATAAPAAASSFAYTVFDDYFYLVGGNGNAGAVFRTSDMVDWTKVGDLPDDNHGGALGAVGRQLIYAGGHNSTVGLFNWVLASPDGGVWTQVGTLPVPREYASAIVIEDRMYVVGGQNTTPTSLAAVSSTADGTSWTVEPSLPAGRAFGAVLQQGDALWSVGGTDLGGVWRGSAGGSWTALGSQFPAPRQGGRAAWFTPP